MQLLLISDSSHPEFSGDCDYAVVDLNAGLLDQIRRRVKLAEQVFREDRDLFELYFWGGTAEFYDQHLVDACQEAILARTEGRLEAKLAAASGWNAALERQGHALVPKGVDLRQHQAQRTECDQLVVRRLSSPSGAEYEIAWLAIPKHADVHVTTRGLPFNRTDTFPRGCLGRFRQEDHDDGHDV